MNLSAKIAAFEVDDDEVRLVLVKTGGRYPLVYQRNSRPVDVELEGDARQEAVAQAIRDLVDELPARPAAFVLCASSRHTIVRPLTVPFKGARRVGAAVRFELEPYLAFPIEDLMVDFAPIRELDGKTQVLAVGLKRAVLEEWLAAFHLAGIDPEGVGLDAAGLTALWQAGRRPPPGLNAVLHVRERESLLVVLNGKTLAYIRHLFLTSSQLHENPMAASREVLNSLRAFQASWDTGEEVSGLDVTGIDLFEDEKRLFEEGFRFPVTYEDLGAKLKDATKGKQVAAHDEPGDSRPRANAWEAAAGVALLAAGGGACAFEFRKEDLAPAHSVRGILQHALFSGIIALLAVTGYAFYMYLDYRANVEELDRTGREMWSMFVEAFPDSPNAKQRPPSDVGGRTSYGFMVDAYEQAGTGRQRLPIELFKQAGVLDLLADISQRMPHGKVRVVRIKLENAATGGPSLTIEGEADDSTVFTAALEELRKSTLLSVSKEPSLKSDATGLKFTIVASIRGATSAEA